jgi:hypothetical protein
MIIFVCGHSQGALDLPDFRPPNETVALFSDYSGEHSRSFFFSYSFLFIAYNYRDIIRDELAELRRRFSLDKTRTEIAYKQLHCGPIRSMLPAYFDALDTFVAGWLITVIVDKAIPTLMGIGGPGAKDYIRRVLEDGGVGGWKPKVAERMLRIAHFASYLSALVLSDGSLWGQVLK